VNEFLIDAVEKSRVAQVVSLLKGAADPNTKDPSGYPVLCSATLKGDLLIVDALLEAGANPNLCSEATQKTPLHYACSISNLFILKALLDKGASDKYGSIPLHEASKEGDKNLVTVLMGRGSSLNAQDADGNTPLHIAARWGQSEISAREVCFILLESEPDVNIADKNGRTPLLLAAYRGDSQIVECSLMLVLI
ncbi:Kinase D-interacting substrate, partial [Armadillidium nasatum]